MRIAVFCSSADAVDDVYLQAARELGRLIAERGHALVYGGCDVGSMGAVARAATAGGAHVLGVIPRAMAESGLGYAAADRTLVVESLAERIARMVENADAFLALPGGFGTLEEIAQVFTRRLLGQPIGPLVLVNVAGFYDHLIAHFERLFAQGMARPEARALYRVAEDPRAALVAAERAVGARP